MNRFHHTVHVHMGNKAVRPVDKDAVCDFFITCRARFFSQLLGSGGVPGSGLCAALSLHGVVANEDSPHISAGLGDHQHTDQGVHVSPQHHRDVETEAQHDGELRFLHPCGAVG